MAPLDDTTHAGFEVRTRVHLYAAAATTGTLQIAGNWSGAQPVSQPVSLVPGQNTVNITIDADRWRERGANKKKKKKSEEREKKTS